MAFVFVCTQLAVKGLRDLATIFNLRVLMVLAEESLGIVRKGFNLIQHLLFSLYFLRPGTEFLESLHRVVVRIISWREEATWLYTSFAVWRCGRFGLLDLWLSWRKVWCCWHTRYGLWLILDVLPCPSCISWWFKRHLKGRTKVHERTIWLPRRISSHWWPEQSILVPLINYIRNRAL